MKAQDEASNIEEAPSGDESPGEDLVELVLAEHARRGEGVAAPRRIDGVVVGRVAAIASNGLPMVDFDERPGEPVVAKSMVAATESDVGRACALMFEGSDPERPIVMGFMFEPAQMVDAPQPAVEPPAARTTLRRTVEQDGERLVFEADQEIVLRCGKASITLTRAGKILIRGAYLLARSSGVNRIQGGSVQIN